VTPDRSDVLDRFEPILEPPPSSFDAFRRKLDRRRRNTRVTAIVVGIVVFALPAWMVTADIVSGRSSGPAISGPPAPTGVRADPALVEAINDCRLLLLPVRTASALGFGAAPTPVEPGSTLGRTGAPEPPSTGCRYASLGWVPDLGEFLPRHDGPGGQLVITAYLADAPPAAMGRSHPVPGLGDAARYSRYGNGDEHLSSYEGATSVLEVHRGDLILRFNGGGFEVVDGVVAQHMSGYPLELMADLARGALVELDRLSGAGAPAGSADAPTPRTRTRTVDRVTFTFSADRSWADGPITRSDGAPRTGHLLISKSVVGPQEAEAVIFWTSVADGPARPCGRWWGSTVGSMGDLADAVASAPGTALVLPPSPVTVGGLPAMRVVVTVREDVGCDPGFFYRWRAGCWGPCWIRSTVGDRISVWVVDVQGKRLFIGAETSARAGAELELEIERIVGSIRFGSP
jgi:hypothetical protein